ncbi:MAG: DHH family phosphoesterase [bacterium]
MESADFNAVRELLSEPKKILLTTHTNPDGDAIGSSLAFFRYLKKKGHHVHVMSPDASPSFLAWMGGHDQILIYNPDEKRCRQLIEEAQLIFSLDYNDLSRLSKAADLVKGSGAIKILMDHHLYPANHFDFQISAVEISSTAELVFEYIVSAGDSAFIDRVIAECIYAGIVTDTGSFSYSCNYIKTYLVVAELYRYGIDGEHIHRLVYDTFSEKRLRLLGYSLSEKLVVLPEFHTAYIYLSASDLERYDYQVGDTEGVVNYALSIQGINLAALFTERDGKIMISFRSKGNFSVEKLARDFFEGGGHSNAAGGTSYFPMDETVTKFRNLLPLFQEQLKNTY